MGLEAERLHANAENSAGELLKVWRLILSVHTFVFQDYVKESEPPVHAAPLL